MPIGTNGMIQYFRISCTIAFVRINPSSWDMIWNPCQANDCYCQISKWNHSKLAEIASQLPPQILRRIMIRPTEYSIFSFPQSRSGFSEKKLPLLVLFLWKVPRETPQCNTEQNTYAHSAIRCLIWRQQASTTEPSNIRLNLQTIGYDGTHRAVQTHRRVSICSSHLTINILLLTFRLSGIFILVTSAPATLSVIVFVVSQHWQSIRTFEGQPWRGSLQRRRARSRPVPQRTLPDPSAEWPFYFCIPKG